MNHRSGTSNGYAYLTYIEPEAAQRALNDLDGMSFQGRLLHIMPAEPKQWGGFDEFAISKLPHKKQQKIRRKAEAGSSIFNWNAMFMNVSIVP